MFISNKCSMILFFTANKNILDLLSESIWFHFIRNEMVSFNFLKKFRNIHVMNTKHLLLLTSFRLFCMQTTEFCSMFFVHCQSEDIMLQRFISSDCYFPGSCLEYQKLPTFCTWPHYKKKIHWMTKHIPWNVYRKMCNREK